MEDVRTSLMAAASEAGLPPARFRAVRPYRWQGLLDNLLDRFTRRGRANARRLWLWEDLRDGAIALRSGGGSDSLRLLTIVMPEHVPVWFVAEDFSREKKMGALWLFETDTDALVRVLAAHHAFEYCVVARDLAWMIRENHHDVLFVLGEPVATRLTAVRAAYQVTV